MCHATSYIPDAVYGISCAMYSTRCTIYNYTMRYAQHTMHNIQCIVECSMYSIWYIQCAVYHVVYAICGILFFNTVGASTIRISMRRQPNSLENQICKTAVK